MLFYISIKTRLGIETKENKIPKAITLTAKFESSLAFIIIAPAKVIVGVALSIMATMLEAVKSREKILSKMIKTRGVKIILAKITIIVAL